MEHSVVASKKTDDIILTGDLIELAAKKYFLVKKRIIQNRTIILAGDVVVSE